MGWSMDTRATSPTDRTLVAQGSSAQGPSGAESVAETATASAPGLPSAQGVPATEAGAQTSPGFVERGRMRRRARFLRKARELAYRDLGGLVFEMHRLGKRHDELVAAKLSVLSIFDAELRALEGVLRSGQSITVLREAGIAACPRCAAIHGSGDHFCPACGLAMGRNADRPIAATPAPPPPPSAIAPGAPVTAVASPTQQALPGPTPSTAQPPPGSAPSQGGVPPTPATPRPPMPPPARAPTPPPPPRQRPRAGGEDDRPTEIIRPSDGVV